MSDIDDAATPGEAKRTRVDHRRPAGPRPDAGPVSMTADDKLRLRSMAAREVRGEARAVAPRAQHCGDPLRRPHGVAEELEQMLPRVSFGLVALRNRAGHSAHGGQTSVGIIAAACGELLQLRGEARAHERCVVAPRHDVLKEDVAMRHPNFSAAEFELMRRREVGVVVAGEEGDGRRVAGKELEDGRANFRGVRGVGARAGVERVAVEHEVLHAIEQRAQLRQAREAARPFAEMKIGNDAEEGGGHVGAKEMPRARGAMAKTLRAILGLGFAGIASVPPPARAADRVRDLTELHLAAMGGAARVAAVQSLRATGEVVTGGKRVGFTLLAARPGRVRLETESNGRIFVQGTDGVEPPWESEPGATPPMSRLMPPAAARTFGADAEFDDPLVAGSARGFTIEDGGFGEAEGKRCARLLVTRGMADTFHLFLDPATFLILRRTEQRTSAVGRRVEIVTRYGDFRPVDGVLLPHLVEVSVEGRVTQQTQINRVEANPTHDPGAFRRPGAS